MNARLWDEHKKRLCSMCRHDRGQRHCPLVIALDKDPTDPMAGRCFQRLGSCSQFEVPPPRKKSEKRKNRQSYVNRRTGKRRD